jgi:hypothetical protein
MTVSEAKKSFSDFLNRGKKIERPWFFEEKPAER